jgi:enoyl-CoA hydratase
MNVSLPPAIANPKSFQLTLHDGLADLVLTGPGKGNAMGPDFWSELPELFRWFDEEEAVRAVLVRGQKGCFSYGLDLMGMAAKLGPFLQGNNEAKARTALHDLIRDLQTSFNRVARCRKPVIAAIDGWCIGGGVDLIAACDVRLCTSRAKFSVREVKIAIVADLGSLQRLPAIIGEGRTRELALSGRNVDADWALRSGLVNDVFDDEASLLHSARALCQEMIQNPPLVVQGIKQVMNQKRESEVSSGLDYVAAWNSAFLQSEDIREAMAAFVEKRPAKFEGR